jgi:hypothetical protein
MSQPAKRIYLLLGEWQGVPRESIKRDYPEAWKRWQGGRR